MAHMNLHQCAAPDVFGMQWLRCRRDVSFYGNKLFQSAFIAIIAPGSSILTGLLWTLLNSIVALARIPHTTSFLRRCVRSALLQT